MVENVKHASELDVISPAFSSFWHELKQQIRVKPTVLTVGEKMLPPDSTYYPRKQEQADAAIFLKNSACPLFIQVYCVIKTF